MGNTFGRRMHPNDGRVVSNFIIQALQDKAMTLYGDGSQTRSFQFVDDLVDGLYKLMNSNYSLPVNLEPRRQADARGPRGHGPRQPLHGTEAEHRALVQPP